MAEIYSVFTITWPLPALVDKVGALALCVVVSPPTAFLDKRNHLPPRVSTIGPPGNDIVEKVQQLNARLWSRVDHH